MFPFGEPGLEALEAADVVEAGGGLDELEHAAVLEEAALGLDNLGVVRGGEAAVLGDALVIRAWTWRRERPRRVWM